MQIINLTQLKQITNNSYFDIEDFGSKVFLATRQNGNVGDEEYSDIDLVEAEKIVAALKKEYGIKADIETCDEWVHIDFDNLDKKATVKLNTIQLNIKKARTSLTSFSTTVFEKIKSQKSLKKTCKHCDSNVSVKFLRNATCPVCDHLMFSTTEQNKFNSLTIKIEKLMKEEEAYK